MDYYSDGVSFGQISSSGVRGSHIANDVESGSSAAYIESYVKRPRTSSVPVEPIARDGSFVRLKKTASSKVRSKKAALKKVLTEEDLQNASEFEAPTVDPVEEKFNESQLQARTYRPPPGLGWLHWLIAPGSNRLHKNVYGSKSRDAKLVGGTSAADHWLIHPDSYFRLAWQALMLTVLLINCFTLPVSIAFFVHHRSNWLGWDAFCDAVFWLDIVISLRTGYVKLLDDATVMNSRQALLHYLRTWFIVDLVGVLPFCYIFEDLYDSGNWVVHYADGRTFTTVRLIKLFDILKVLRIARLLRYNKASHEIAGNVMSVLKYLKLFGVMFLLCHWNGCLNFYVPALLNFPENSWVLLGNMQNKGWFEQYTNALFKSVSAMITTGYGVNAPVILPEVIVMSWCIISASIVYGMFIGHTVSVISGFDASRRSYSAQLQKVQEFLSARKIPEALRDKVFDFYDFKYRGKMFNEDDIISHLSDPLKEEVIVHTRETLMKTVPLLATLQSGFVTEIVSGLKPEVFQPGDEIISAGDSGDAMYFLTEGLAEVTTADGLFVTKLTNGAYFGEVALLTGKRRSATIHALTHCRAYSLPKVTFDQAFGEHPEMRKMLALKSLKRIRKLSKLSDMKNLIGHMDAIYKIVNGILESERTTPSDALRR